MQNEVLLTNNLGGYLSFSLTQGNTRKYHGLLVASLDRGERYLTVATTTEELEIGGERHILKPTDLYRSYYLPNPRQIYRYKGVEVIKEYFMEELQNKVTITYTLKSPVKSCLTIKPLLTFRNIHKLGLVLDKKDLPVTANNRIAHIELSKDYSLILETTATLKPIVEIWPNFIYPEEKARGYEHSEDLLSAISVKQVADVEVKKFTLVFTLKDNSLKQRLLKTAQRIMATDTNDSILTDVARFHNLYPFMPEFSEFLVYNARKFIINNGRRTSLIAGYHWFGEWGRDTFISFKGVFLGLGRYKEAREVLLTWSKYISGGLLPNQLDQLTYNSADAFLWYEVALWHYYQETKDKSILTELISHLEQAVIDLVAGIREEIAVDDRGYLVTTNNNLALTWMDAKVDGRPVTGRNGASVEVQALWYNFLQIVEKLGFEINYKFDNLTLFDRLEKLIEDNFDKDFWIADKGYYADFIGIDGIRNEQLRPNQLAAWGLPFTLGSQEKFAQFNLLLEEKLLTTIGLRTLAPEDISYHADYQGDQKSRDLAYHQGTVWVWPLILYYNSLKKYNYNEDLKEHLQVAWAKIHTDKSLSIYEIYSAQELKPVGAIAQAWSIAAFIEGITLVET